MENGKIDVEYSAITDPELITDPAPNVEIQPLKNLPIEVTTPHGKKLIFETPELAARYLPIEAASVRNVLTGILNETNGYKARYFTQKHY